MKDHLGTVGCHFLSDKFYKYDPPNAQLIKKSGAIVLVRGNAP